MREHNGGAYLGTNYKIDLTSKAVVDFVAETGKEYDVFYFTNNASAKVLELSSNFKPSVATISYKFEVYAKQNGSVGNGTRQGFLYFVVMRAQFSGDVGISANQTTAATTDYSWNALADVDNMPSCEGCEEDGSPYAYYVYVPCGDSKQSVEGLAVIGGGITVKAGAKAQIPVKYVVDGKLGQPVYTEMSYVSSETSIATVSTAGVVEGKTAGDSVVTITLTKADGNTLKTTCAVKVTA